MMKTSTTIKISHNRKNEKNCKKWTQNEKKKEKCNKRTANETKKRENGEYGVGVFYSNNK